MEEQWISCPYCGEMLTVLIDPTEIGDSYTEDCQVCCAPIIFELRGDATQIEVIVRSEDE